MKFKLLKVAFVAALLVSCAESKMLFVFPIRLIP